MVLETNIHSVLPRSYLFEHVATISRTSPYRDNLHLKEQQAKDKKLPSNSHGESWNQSAANDNWKALYQQLGSG